MFLLLAVIASGFVVRLLPIPLPLPLVQIGLGAVIATMTNRGVPLQPELFFLLFLPPLLFLDGWRIPKQGIYRDSRTILQLALGLVVFTVLGMGFFIHWLIPHMPLAVAFALAAVLSPTDPVAVSAIAARAPIPKRMMRILEGEALLNDASGLVCLRFAVAAALTGTFSLPHAVMDFLWVAAGGLAIGAAFTWGVTWAKGWLARRLGEEPGTEILISLLIPFGAYIVAEEVGVSAILAAVAAGVTMSYAEVVGQVTAITRVRRGAVWDSVQFTANGIIFVLLGEQFPAILRRAVAAVREAGHHEPWWLLLYVVAITVALAALRLLWVWASLRFSLLRSARKGEPRTRPHWRLVVAMSLAGVRGAITLAGILTLPITLPGGAPFPDRDLAIFLASGVILLSLIAASAGLPHLLARLDMPPEPEHDAEEDKARVAAARAAIKAVEASWRSMAEGESDADLHADAGKQIMDLYRRRIDGRSVEGQAGDARRRSNEIERALRLAALDAERAELFRLAREDAIADDLARRLVREIDLMEARYRL